MSTPGSAGGNARGRATVRSIETAAVRLALEQGAAALTVDQICDAAGIKQRTFFNHFRTKEDALLGSALPVIDEQRTREYLTSHDTGVLTGALTLVDIPGTGPDEDDLATDRLRLLMASPALAERQASRLLPLVDEMRAIIRLKLVTLRSAEPDERLDDAATTITQIVGALLLRPRRSETQDPPLAELRWVWPHLL